MTAGEIRRFIKQRFAWYGQLFVPEFTFNGLRIDAILIDTNKRWIRGFEIKVSRADFLRDEKWAGYSQFCSSLSIACPRGLIDPKEVPDPFGLLWVGKNADVYGKELDWQKKPKNFQKRDALAWTWTYLRVLEAEFVRLVHENERLQPMPEPVEAELLSQQASEGK